MSNDMLDQDEHLQRLLRDTFSARAATVHHGPQWTGVAPRHNRSTWLTVAASVIAVALIATGVAVWQGHNTTPVAGAPKAAEVKLPAAWRTALHAAPVRLAGKSVQLQAVLPSGAAIVTEQRYNFDPSTIALVDPSGTTRTVYRAPAGRWVSGIRSDGRWLVFALHRDVHLVSADDVSQVLAVDLEAQPGAAPRNITAAALPAGYVHHGADFLSYDGRNSNGQRSFLASLTDNLELLRGVVYLIAVHPGSRTSHGLVVAYTLANGQHRIVGSATRFDSPGDARGVFWRAGRIRTGHVPSLVPAYSQRRLEYGTPARNGAAWAWDTDDRGNRIRWTDGVTTRSWEVRITGSNPDVTRLEVAAVDGPFVVLIPTYPTDGGHALILDSRTGAYIDTGLKGYGAKANGKTVAIYYRAHGRYETTLLDVRGLPQLHR